MTRKVGCEWDPLYGNLLRWGLPGPELSFNAAFYNWTSVLSLIVQLSKNVLRYPTLLYRFFFAEMPCRLILLLSVPPRGFTPFLLLSQGIREVCFRGFFPISWPVESPVYFPGFTLFCSSRKFPLWVAGKYLPSRLPAWKAS